MSSSWSSASLTLILRLLRVALLPSGCANGLAGGLVIFLLGALVFGLLAEAGAFATAFGLLA